MLYNILIYYRIFYLQLLASESNTLAHPVAPIFIILMICSAHGGFGFIVADPPPMKLFKQFKKNK